MRRWMQLGGALALAFAVTACADNRGTDTDDATVRPGDEAVGTSGAGEARIDEAFVEEQMAMGHAEVQLGELAQQRAQHPEVKRFGEMMVRDHRQANQELERVLSSARTGGAVDRSEPLGDHREHVDELRELSGSEFDREYMDRMVRDHEQAVRELERRAENATHPEIRQWVSKTLPTVQQHLERAKQIRETLNADR